MSRLLWGLSRVVRYQLEDDPVCSDFVKTLADAERDMIERLRELGVDVTPFENYEIKVAASEHPDN
jgi:hypothetical protein